MGGGFRTSSCSRWRRVGGWGCRGLCVCVLGQEGLLRCGCELGVSRLFKQATALLLLRMFAVLARADAELHWKL